MTTTTPPCSYASPHQTYHPLNLPARASRGWLHMLQAMMSVLNVRSAGVTPCSDNTGQMPFRKPTCWCNLCGCSCCSGCSGR